MCAKFSSRPNSKCTCSNTFSRFGIITLTFLLSISCLFSSSIFLTGCTKSKDSTLSNQRFEKMTRELFCQEISGNSVSLHYTLENPKDYGIEEGIPTFGTISTDSELSGMAMENTLSVVEKFDEELLSKKNCLTKEVLEDYLKSSMGGLKYQLYQEPLSTVNGVQGQIPVMLSEFRLENEKDVKTYLGLLDTLPSYFQSVIAFEEEKSKQGLFMSDAVADVVIQQCQAFIDMGDANYLISTFVNRLKTISEISAEKKDIYIENNAKAVTDTITNAYKNLKHQVELLKGTGVNKAGLFYFPEGQQYYSYLAMRETGSSRTVPEMKTMAKTQIVEDLESMEDELGLNVSATMSKSNAISMLQDLEQKSEKAFPKSPKIMAQIKYVPSSMEEVLSPAFYMIPPIDNISKNIIYVNQSQITNPLSLYTTLAHEGFPGHLYQTTYYANQKPDEIRSIMDYGGYTEGWATYAEMLSYYLAPLTKTQAVLCQKNASIILGLYALADIGIHYDGWQREDALRFFQKYGIHEKEVVSKIYDLILGDPGNYLKYYIGYLELLNIKKDAMKQLGDSFSQQNFHKVVLETGPAPFDIVRERVKVWITSGQE